MCKPAEAVDDHAAEAPHHDHRQQVVAPLHAQARDGVGRQHQHRDDAEVGRIPDVAAVDAEHVLRRDRDRRAQRVRPDRRRAHQHADADAGDVRAREVRPRSREQRARARSRRAIAVAIASTVRDQLSRNPNVSWPTSRTIGDQDRREIALVDAAVAARGPSGDLPAPGDRSRAAWIVMPAPGCGGRGPPAAPSAPASCRTASG